MLCRVRGSAAHAARALHASAAASVRVKLEKARDRCCALLRGASRAHAPPHALRTQDVPSLGSAGDIVEVSPGHARNYLVPGRMAVPVRAPGRGRGAAAQAAAQAEESAAAPRAAAAGKDDPARALEEAQEAVRRLTVAPLVRAGAARLPSWLANPDRAAPRLLLRR